MKPQPQSNHIVLCMKHFSALSAFIFFLAAFFPVNPTYIREFIAWMFLPWFGCYCIAMALHDNSIRVSNRFVWYGIAFVVSITLSYAGTQHASINYEPLLRLVLGMAALFIGYYFLSKKDLGSMAVAIACASTIVGLWWIAEKIFVDNSSTFNNIMFHKNALGLFMAMSIPLTLSIECKTFRRSAAAITAASIQTIALGMSKSAGACGFLVIASIITVAIYWFYERKVNTLFIVTTILIAITLCVSGWQTLEPGRLIDKTLHGDRTVHAFPIFWNMICEKPLFGHGIGNMYLPAKAGINIGGPHNLYILLHGAGGAITVALFLLLALPAIFRRGEYAVKVVLLTFVMYGYYSALAVTFPTNIVLWGLLTGYCLQSFEYKAFKLSATSKFCIVTACFSLSMFTTRFAFRSFKADMLVLSAIHHNAAGNPKLAFQCCNTALEIEPRYVKGLSNRAAAEVRLGMKTKERKWFEMALRDFKEALRLCPKNETWERNIYALESAGITEYEYGKRDNSVGKPGVTFDTVNKDINP